jgi:ribosome-binding protein aMBF1 (putative translation factor)
MHQVEVGELVRVFLEREGMSQAELAQRVGVSQATVSRAMNQQALRPSPARARLSTFMQEQKVEPGPDTAFRAVKEVWDGSSAHAAALARLVRASGELWPRLGRE